MKQISLILIPILVLAPTVALADSNSLYIPAWERGYVEAWNGLPISGHGATYVDGYNNAIHDLKIWGKTVHFGPKPIYMNDNYTAFYSGFHKGVSVADGVHSGETEAKWNNNELICPHGHSSEYCAGYRYGYNVTDFANDPPDT